MQKIVRTAGVRGETIVDEIPDDHILIRPGNTANAAQSIATDKAVPQLAKLRAEQEQARRDREAAEARERASDAAALAIQDEHAALQSAVAEANKLLEVAKSRLEHTRNLLAEPLRLAGYSFAVGHDLEREVADQLNRVRLYEDVIKRAEGVWIPALEADANAKVKALKEFRLAYGITV